MLKRTESYFKAYDNTEIFFQSWLNPDANGTIVLTHGAGEHSEAYVNLAAGILPGKWDICALDLRGHGKSQGKRGVVNDFMDYCRDVRTFAQLIQNEKQSHKFVLLGHSMGGLINARALIEYGHMGFTAAAFSSPFFGVAVKVPPLKDAIAKWIGNYLPNITLYNEIVYSDLSHDEQVIESYSRDPLRHDRLSPKLYLDFLANIDYVFKNASKIELPVFMQLAGADKIVSLEASLKFFDAIASQDKKKIVYEDFYHEIFNEVGRQKVFADLKEYLNQCSQR